MSRKALLSVLLIFALAAAVFPAPAQAQAPTFIYIVNGINGLDVGQLLMQNPVDISISGLGCVASNLMFRSYVGPVVLPISGSYTVSLSPANLTIPCSNPAAVVNVWSVSAGQPYVLLAHLISTGGQAMSLIPYNLSHTTKDNGKARFTFVNGAKINAVDVFMRGKKGTSSKAVLGLFNSQGNTFQIRSGNYKMQFNQSGTGIITYGPINMKTVRFHHYFIALVGSPTNGFFTASFSVNTYPFNPIPYNPFPWP